GFFLSLCWCPNLLRFAVSKSVEICRFLVFLVDHFRVGVHYFEGVFKLRLVCLGSHSTVISSAFSLKELFFGF
ncbi:hypothetical protein L195_g058676, partial [Trifolium pratense]